MNTINKKLSAVEYSCVYFIGAFGYSCLELLWRGYTHWTMAVTGGACFTIIHFVEKHLGHKKFWIKCAVGAACITAIEFLVGCIVNRILKWGVWSYADRPGNLLGQICPLFAVIWFVLCVPLFPFCKRLHRFFVTHFDKP
ncbi:MAG: hypothetical protein RR287_05620 [Oscillospiraceae bacterium]